MPTAVPNAEHSEAIAALERANAALRTRVAEFEAQLARAGDGSDAARLGEGLREREALLSEAERIAGVGSWFWDVETNEVVWSAQLFRILGFDPQTHKASHARFFERVHPDDRERVRRASETATVTGRNEQVDHRLLLPDGQVRYVSTDGALLHDSSGRLRRAVGTVIDLTARREEEFAVRRSELMLRELAENIHAVFWLTSVDKNRLDYVSPGYEHIWGRSASSLYQTPTSWLDSIHADDRERVRAALAGQLGGTYEETYRIVRPDGEIRWIRDRAFPVTGPAGELYRIAGVATDITATVEAETQLEHQAAALRELANRLTQTEQRVRSRVADVLHNELQQLLVSLQLKIDALPFPKSGALVSIKEVVRQCLIATKTLATQLRPPALSDGRFDLALDWLVLWEADNHGLEVRVRGETAPPLNLDLGELVFGGIQELLFNVVKHANVTTADVEIATLGGELTVVVRDRGVGLREGRQGVDLMRAGTGLVTLRERLRPLGGRLELAPTAGGGCSALLTVPMEMPKRAVPRGAAFVPSASGDRVRLLIVDDHALVLEGLAELLGREPRFEIVGTATNGELALEAVRRLVPHVVLMDVNMPVLDGIEATRRITAEFSKVRVIGLSMHDDHGTQERMRRAGAAAYFNKGAVGSELIEAILRSATGAGASLPLEFTHPSPGTPRR